MPNQSSLDQQIQNLSKKSIQYLENSSLNKIFSNNSSIESVRVNLFKMSNTDDEQSEKLYYGKSQDYTEYESLNFNNLRQSDSIATIKEDSKTIDNMEEISQIIYSSDDF